jgi:predicted porin
MLNTPLASRRLCPCALLPLVAGLGLGLTSLSVSAQSGLQISGSAAASVMHVSNQATGAGTRMVSGPWTAPSLVFSGTEDLGDGLKAIFRIESTLEVDSGVGGRTVLGTAKTWDKAAWVGLGNAQFTLTAGRQLHAGIDRIAMTLDPFYANADGKLLLSTLALNATNSFGGFDTRADSALKLRVPLPGGFSLGLSHAFAQAGRFGRSQSFDLGQQTPDYGLGLYLLRYRNDAGTLEQSTWGLGGNVAVGKGRAYVHYMDATLDKSAHGATQQTDKVIGLGLTYPLGAATTLRTAYYQDSGSAIGGVSGREGKRRTFTLMGEYAFSKRTSLNAGVFNNRLSGAFSSDPTSLSVLGLINPATFAVTGNSMTGVTVGLNHRF